MDEVIEQMNRRGVRYLLIGGQAMRLTGMPRYSMDWDFYIPSRDAENLANLNDLLKEELDSPVEPLGDRGENFIQTFQTRFGILQFHLGGPGLPPFDQADRDAVERTNENGTRIKCMSDPHLLEAKLAANRPQDQQDIQFLRIKLHQGDDRERMTEEE